LEYKNTLFFLLSIILTQKPPQLFIIFTKLEFHNLTYLLNPKRLQFLAKSEKIQTTLYQIYKHQKVTKVTAIRNIINCHFNLFINNNKYLNTR